MCLFDDDADDGALTDNSLDLVNGVLAADAAAAPLGVGTVAELNTVLPLSAAGDFFGVGTVAEPNDAAEEGETDVGEV